MGMHCAHARLVWNVALEHFEWSGSRRRCDISSWDRELTGLRAEVAWLAAGSSSVQQGALRDLRQAIQNWWKNPAHFRRPTRRSRKDGHGGFVVRDLSVTALSRKWATVTIPKCGPVKLRLSRPLPAGCRSARVTEDRAGRWHVSFVAPQPDVARTATGTMVGVDMGVAHAATLSTGEHLHPQDRGEGWLSRGEAQRLRRLQRQLARQRRGSRRSRATRAAIARVHARVADRRKDWIEQATTRLVRDHDLIAVEDLNVTAMIQSHRGTLAEPGVGVTAKSRLNKSISDLSWGTFRLRLEQKAAATPAEHRCTVVAVNPAYTSRSCHQCGHTAAENRESQATFSCQACGHTDNADINAARNILAAGLAVTGRGGTSHHTTTAPRGRNRQRPCETPTPTAA
jgi:putative transposase